MARKSKPKTSRSKVRSSWRGLLQFGLVSFPVQAFNAHAKEQERLAFHQLHSTCHSRIHHEKVCPVHGPVSNDEIVLGYEYAKGEYVEVEPEEFEKLRPAKERALTIDAFVASDAIDPIYFDGRMYYLAPDGAEAKEPYAIFLRAMKNEQRYGVGQVIFSGKQQIVLVRPYENALHMAMLHYAAAIQPTTVLGPAPKLAANDKKLALAEELIEKWGDEDFRFSDYVDRYDVEMKKLVEAKARGHELVAPEEEEEAPVYNLMDALRKSMERNSGRKTSATHAKTVRSNGDGHRPARRPASRAAHASTHRAVKRRGRRRAS